MPRNRLQQRSDELAARVEALAAALHASGVAEDAVERLLTRASTAVLQALTLELLLHEPDARGGGGRGPRPASELAQPGLRLVA